MTIVRMLVSGLVWSVGLAACVRTPMVRFYTLAEGAPVRAAPALPARYTVRVGPSSVPETLDRPELVLRVSATELAIDDNHRWAESLRSGVSRAVAGDLERELERDGALVMLADEGSARETDVEVTVDVQRLDARLGEGATVDVRWMARWTDGGVTRAGRSVAAAPAAGTGGYDALVAACAQALASVSREIAGAIKTESGARR